VFDSQPTKQDFLRWLGTTLEAIPKVLEFYAILSINAASLPRAMFQRRQSPLIDLILRCVPRFFSATALQEAQLTR
jgi:hypothetical protein